MWKIVSQEEKAPWIISKDIAIIITIATMKYFNKNKPIICSCFISLFHFVRSSGVIITYGVVKRRTALSLWLLFLYAVWVRYGLLLKWQRTSLRNNLINISLTWTLKTFYEIMQHYYTITENNVNYTKCKCFYLCAFQRNCDHVPICRQIKLNKQEYLLCRWYLVI